jgi:hypothetical protein
MTETRDVVEASTVESGPGELAEATRRGHEVHDFPLRPVLLVAASLGALVLISFVLTTALQSAFRGREARNSPPANPLARTGATAEQPPEPRLQVNPLGDLVKLRAAEDGALDSYGWVDRNLGTVRIPIARAIELTVERGISLPAGPPAGPPEKPAGDAR